MRCGPLVAHQLRQLYNVVLRHFDQVYINSIVARLRNLGQLPQPSQPQAQPYQPTEADYQALLVSITPETSVFNAHTIRILLRFSHTSGVDLEAHHVPPYVITFVEQNREHLQRAAQENGLRAGLASTENAPLDNRIEASALHPMARLQQLQRQALVQGPGKLNALQSAQLFNNVGPLVPPSTALSMSASSMPSMGAQITGSNSSGGVQNQGGVMPVSMNPAAMNGVISDSTLTQSSGAMQIRRPTQEEVIAAKRYVDEKKRMAFSCGKPCLLYLSRL